MLQSLILALPGLPDAPLLRTTTALLLGAYAPWVADSVRGGAPPELITGSMRLLLAGIAF